MVMMRTWQSRVAALIMMGMIPTATSAQKGEGETLLDDITRCRSITARDRRLVCYDEAADALTAARANDDVTVLTREEIAEKRRSLFGLPLPEANLFGRGAERMPQIETLDSSVTRVVASGRDRLTVTLADGSIWHTTERARIDPNVGDNVHIRRAALGSYLASFAGTRGVRIERSR